MLEFQMYMPTRIIFGPDKLEELGSTPHLPAGSKAMIVISGGGSMIRNGYLDRVQGLLSENGVSSIVYDKIRPNPESAQVEEAAEIVKAQEIDFIVGLGGGSSIDSAKAIALLSTNGGKYWDYMSGGTGGNKKPRIPALPIVAIPTTAGTGTEADPWTVITKTGGNEKIGWGNDSTFPKLSIVDPKLTLSVPPRTTAYTGMDAFFHAVEAYLATCSQPSSNMLALEAVHLISHYLPLAVKEGDNLDARTALMWANTAAGLCETYSSCISQHSIEHAISGFYPDVPHGAGLTMLSKSYFSYLLQIKPERFEELALAMGDESVYDMAPEDRPQAFITALDRLIEQAGLGDEKLSNYGVKKEDIPAMAKCAFDTMGGLFEITPIKMNEDDVVAILENAEW
ncbi:MAG: iron-containing alcohol dehydrogenase [Desulfovibrio sp.]